MKAVILAGGSGTRLWPLSRKNYPKQFLKINRCGSDTPCAFDKGSLLQQTVHRLLRAVTPGDIVVLTNTGYRFHVKADLDTIADGASHHVVLEPVRRNTAPALALAIAYCTEQLGCSGDEVIFVSPSDHLIEPEEPFLHYLRAAALLAQERLIVTFGIAPLYPETGYGYISVGEPLLHVETDEWSVGYHRVNGFTEKPDLRTAERYLKEGTYYWNSGMFAFTIRTMQEELARHAPEISAISTGGYEGMLAAFDRMPDISIDYAVMEKSDRVVTIPSDIYWNDVGSWDSIFSVLPRDSDGNARVGDVMTAGTRNSLIMSEKRLIATVGIDDLLVVETDDAILVAKQGEAQRVKDIVDMLNRKGRRESAEHTTTYRPWGSYTILEEGPRYKIKRIVINREAKLSLQMHHHRSEHWVVIKGTARVTVGDEVKFVHENESTYIPKSTLHRLENAGKVPLEIIEVQNGEYVEEDDITRIDDLYGR